MKGHVFIGAILLTVLLTPQSAMACPNLTKAGERMKREREKLYLRENSNKIVRGVWRADEPARNPGEDYLITGYVEVSKGGKVLRYRVSIPGEINCGFPNYYVDNGDEGRFYLRKSEYPDDDDADDGFIDHYRYVHFKP